jgi:hypothetical protein
VGRVLRGRLVSATAHRCLQAVGSLRLTVAAADKLAHRKRGVRITIKRTTNSCACRRIPC